MFLMRLIWKRKWKRWDEVFQQLSVNNTTSVTAIVWVAIVLKTDLRLGCWNVRKYYRHQSLSRLLSTGKRNLAINSTHSLTTLSTASGFDIQYSSAIRIKKRPFWWYHFCLNSNSFELNPLYPHSFLHHFQDFGFIFAQMRTALSQILIIIAHFQEFGFTLSFTPSVSSRNEVLFVPLAVCSWLWHAFAGLEIAEYNSFGFLQR